MALSTLLPTLEKIAHEARLGAWAISWFDSAGGQSSSHHGGQSFHAASTFKVALLLAFAQAVQNGQVRPQDHLQVRNRFLGLTDGLPYRIASDRDGDGSVHARIGRSWPLGQLARVMITRSSNLATNLLLDFLTLDFIQKTLRDHEVVGVEVRRGVEDLTAHEQGLNNETTADGLCQLLRCFLPGGRLAKEPRRLALEILQGQEFNRMLPALLPKGVTVAHKTGEISTHCHDAGLVFPPGRDPYVVAILTETLPETTHRQRAVAEMSAALYRVLVREETP